MRQGVSDAAKQREQDCWKHAHSVLCASSFTRDSLVEAGLDPQRCRVLPYGVDLPRLAQQRPSSYFRALFVGSGIQRKGLHHLLEAWKRASLPRNSELILVCRVTDPGIREMAVNMPGVRLLPGVSHAKLCDLFQSSSLFVMPSLVEGFGQVYLEALSYGCPVLGTKHTCLPDLGSETDGIYLSAVGDLDHLQGQIERLSELLPGNAKMRAQARACAARFPWEQFRKNLRDCLP
jgi:glycosyltransferase involved in cell wall biosynthesis